MINSNYNNNIAVRSELLIEARYKLTKTQNDILDYVLSKLKDDSNVRYRLEIKEFAKLYRDSTHNLYRNLKAAVRKMEAGPNSGFKTVNVNKEVYYHWFAVMTYCDREGSIEVELSNTLKSMMLNSKRRIYYDIRYSLNLTSIYSQRLYYLLKLYQDTGWRIDKLEDLSNKLYCPSSYTKLSNFKSRVLEPAKKEINETTDIRFEYTFIKKKDYTLVRFTINKTSFNFKDYSSPIRSESSFNKGTESSIQNPDGSEGTKASNHQLSSQSPKVNINNELINKVKNTLFNTTISNREAIQLLIESNYNINKIKDCYNTILNKNIGNPVGYLIVMLRNSNKRTKSTLRFNNYKSREYSDEQWKNLELKLLGWD